MHARVNFHELEARDIDDVEPDLLAVGYELRPKNMRPNVWVFDPGESNNRHRQREQEELYFVVSGRLEMEVEGERFEIEAGDVVIVPPESWRQMTAIEASEVFVVGAPNVKDDAIDEGTE